MTLRDLGLPSIIALVLAPICVSVALFAPSRGGGLEYWPLSVIGVIALLVAFAKTRRWWLFALAPFHLAPLFLVSLLILACLNGDCL